MINRYPLWKYVLIVAVLAVACVFAAPNLYEEDPAVQISAERNVELDDAVLERVVQALSEARIEPKSAAFEAGRILVRFADGDAQLRGIEAIRNELQRGFIIALNLAPTTPNWLRDLGALPMYLGLDLRGGVHFLMEVDMDAAVTKAEEDESKGEAY